MLLEDLPGTKKFWCGGIKSSARGVSQFQSLYFVIFLLSLCLCSLVCFLIRPKRIHFPELFAVVLILTCVFWIQLTWTNAVFSRITLVSCFCAENQLLGKTPEIIAKSLFSPKTPGARRRDGEGQGGPHHMAAQWAHGRATTWCGWLGHPSRPPLYYLTPLT